MNDVCIFINTSITEQGRDLGLCAEIANRALTPFHYLFKASKVLIDSTRDEVTVHHVAAFHRSGVLHSSPTEAYLYSSDTSMLRTIASIVLLPLGLFIGILSKLFSYADAHNRENHRLVKEHFTPVDRHIGSVDRPITTIDELRKELFNERLHYPKNPPTNALIIHGDGDLTINEDPGNYILPFKPMKLILEGTHLVHERAQLRPPLDEQLHNAGTWQSYPKRPSRGTYVQIHHVNSTEEALQTPAPRRSLAPWSKHYHMVFETPRGKAQIQV